MRFKLEKILGYIVAFIIMFLIFKTVLEYIHCEGTYVRTLFWMECIDASIKE